MTSNLEKLCTEKGMRMTGQRRIVAQVLEASADHPDVEEPRISAKPGKSS